MVYISQRVHLEYFRYRGTSRIRHSAPLGPCLGPYIIPRGGAVSYEPGTPEHPGVQKQDETAQMPNHFETALSGRVQRARETR